MQSLITLVEKGLMPDVLTRFGIRQLLRERADRQRPSQAETRSVAIERLLAAMREGPIAVATDSANEQHYEVPSAFFQQVLGPHLKYSCCLWEPGTRDLAQAEAAMLALSCERADLADGQEILELGCGWGALTLWMAEHYPAARITALSNSASQRALIEERARERGLDNLQVITADINDFQTAKHFDRVVSLEMFEHMRNWGELTRRVGQWLRPGGKLFMHIFCHRDFPYFFETDGERDWMARHFFTGGLMPSDELPARFQDHFRLQQRWRVNGRHYARTCGAWLANQDARRGQLMPIMEASYGKRQARIWFNRWRMFFMASEEFFGFRRGEEWWVSHYLFRKPGEGEQ
ncbi:SAM-dependent methyltransferase [Natronospira bacteriovora]|uniref:Cyclopropane-fatty-acyl-phospholipid synthase family protein n=1 Tax=Natronospira bacteriovora TaxID=3069753 RepID=A0ABU0W4H7_9GAMM|nr:cyclopropane-fatty-acyl-phospholipid synthase family protein [Natronospira sp. AB-CW4]MDQ2068867.1 cyclopropane-fatty-acyl-phospholipid synthase family protein [Natronospira sp. AB-CW4]